MGSVTTRQLLRLLLPSLLLAPPSVFALLNLDGTRNQVFVFGEASLAYDSNIFAQNGGPGDYSEGLTFGADLKRNAGLITVNATASVAFVRYDRHTDLNEVNPALLVELAKNNGRLTGSLTVNAFRTEQADSAVNLRTTSWNFPADLRLRYPLNEKFYVTSETTYVERRYLDTSAGLSNYTDVSEGLDAAYVYTSKLDLFAGYRVRLARTDAGRTTDHNFSLGATGRLLAKLSGTVRFGYQIRQVAGTHDSFSQLSALGQLTWTATRKLTVTGLLSRDFSTTATADSVDTVSTSLSAAYALTRRFACNTGVGYGRNHFLGQDAPYRLDNFFSWNVGASYSLNDHFKIATSYSYFHNVSNLNLAEFDRQQFSVDVSSRF